MSTAVNSGQPPLPDRVWWPHALPLFVGLVPFVLLACLAYWPASRDWINRHALWAAAIGAAAVLLWLGVLGGALAWGLDFWLRTFDFMINRTYGPDVRGWSRPRQLGFLLRRGGLLHGYSLPIALCTFL